MEQEWNDINKIPQDTIVVVSTINKEGEENPIVDRKRKPIRIKILPDGTLIMIHSGGETKIKINNYLALKGVKNLIFSPLQA